MRYLILGTGVSGLGALTFLAAARAHNIFVCDDRPPKPETLSIVAAKSAAFITTPTRREELAALKIDRIILSQSVVMTHPLVLAAKELRIETLSEIDIALENYRGKTIAITGTNGKSTVCAMVAYGLCRLGFKANAVGNIGVTPSELAAHGRLGDFISLELASYQLEKTKFLTCTAGVFSSFSFDHLDHHGSMRNYLEAKWHLTKCILPDGLFILSESAHAAAVQNGLVFPKVKTLLLIPNKDALGGVSCLQLFSGSPSTQPGLSETLFVRGFTEPYNIFNASCAMFAIEHVSGISRATINDALLDYVHLPFRNQLVGHLDSIPIFNDSKSTNLESVMAAIDSKHGPLLLLIGGKGKGESYSSLVTMKKQLGLVLAFGESAEKIVGDLNGEIPIQSFSLLKDALPEIPKIVSKLPCKPSAIVFSPGCASFDEFTNYEDRGRVFNEYASNWAGFRAATKKF